GVRARAGAEGVAREKPAAERSARQQARIVPPPPPPPSATASVPTSENSRKRTAPPPAKPAEALDVKLHVRQHAQVTLDDRDLGDSNAFSIQVSPRPPRVVARPSCSVGNDLHLVL